MMKKIILFILILFLASKIKAQNITGKVFEIQKNGKKSPLIGVNVYWENTNIGTITNEEGKYSISQPTSLPATLNVSFIGFTLIDKEEVNSEYIFYLEQSINLDEVTITENKNTTNFSTINPLNIQTISTGEILKAACCNLSECFETNAAVDVSYSDAISGLKTINMLGLSGKYVQITNESMPLINGLLNSYGLSYVPGSWIESIQVTKGIGSVLNGYNSITGQINLQYFNNLNADEIFLNTYTNSEGKVETNLLLAKKKGKWKNNLFAHISYLDREIDRHGTSHDHSTHTNHQGDGFLDVPKIKQFNFMNKLKYTGSEKYVGSIILKKLWEERIGGQKQNIVNNYMVNTTNDLSEINTKTGYIFNDINKSIGVQTKWKYHDQNIQFGNNKYLGIQEQAYLNLMINTYIDNLNHKIIYGASYNANRFTESFSGNINQSFSDKKRVDLVSGIFAEYNYKYKEKLSINTGFRSDYYNIENKIYYSPRLHVKYNPNENSVIRFSVGKGFRIANNIIENMPYLASSRNIILDNNSNIESATNIGLNYSYCFYLFKREATFNFDIYNTAFEEQVIVDIENQSELIFYNIEGESYANSMQFDFSYELFKGLDFKTAYKINNSYTNYRSDFRKTALTPVSRVLLNLAYATNSDKWKIDFTSNYIGESRIPKHDKISSEKSKPFNLLNSQITRKINTFDLYLGVENILNYVQENPIIDTENPFSNDFDASLIYGPVMGRLIYAGLRYKYNR